MRTDRRAGEDTDAGPLLEDANPSAGHRMPRWPEVAFVVLAAATAVAFFWVQHLKTTPPLLGGRPRPDPPTFNPVAGGICKDLAGKRVSYRTTRIGFYLGRASDTVTVYAVTTAGNRIATLAGSGKVMRVDGKYRFFTWDGREYGGAIAPAGVYHLEVVLAAEHEQIVLPMPVKVQTARPEPRVLSASLAPKGNGQDVRSAGRRTVVIRWKPEKNFRGAAVQVYRVVKGDAPLRLVKTFGVDGRRGHAEWDGMIHHRPAPAGSYVFGLQVLDSACTRARARVTQPTKAGAITVARITIQ